MIAPGFGTAALLMAHHWRESSTSAVKRSREYPAYHLEDRGAMGVDVVRVIASSALI